MKRFGLLILVCFVFISNYGLTQDSLVGYWSFDKYSLDFFRDESGFSNNGTAFNESKTSGIKGSALTFYGTDSFAKIRGKGKENKPPTLIANLAEGSISIWFRVEHIPIDYGIAPLLYFGSTANVIFLMQQIKA